ncbi:MAG: DUF3052 family protein [Balneolaceae bacterium]|nr:DUF3052 family protein [Balneolaceae bacterium]
MAGYSGTPLLRKLGIKPGYTIMTVHEPDHYFEILGKLPQATEVVDTDTDKAVDFIHVFCKDEESLHTSFPVLKEKLRKDGMIWVSWIKKASKIHSDITGNDVRELGLQIGLVDIKVCAVDDDWSALKFMYRKEDR